MPSTPDLKHLDSIWDKYRNDYSGKWITTAWMHYGAGLYAEAAHAFEKARDGFGKRSMEWQRLEAWRLHAATKAGQ